MNKLILKTNWHVSLFYLIACGMILIGLAACVPSSYTPKAAVFEPGNCPTYLRGKIEMICGELLVPENREKRDSPTIRIKVAIVKSEGEAPAADPVLYLPGGPGGSGFDEVLSNLAAFRSIRDMHDLVIFDPRGVGFSLPRLDCDEYDRAFFDGLDDLPYLETQDEEKQAFLDCQKRLKAEGIDLSQYNNQEIARDIEELRLALGIKQWNLFGVSYGARLALTVLRDFPEGVRSVILDSTIPPEVEPYSMWVFSFGAAFNRMVERCLADASCRQAYPNPKQEFFSLVEKLNKTPITLAVANYSGSVYDVAVDGDVWLHLAFILFYNRSDIAGLPLLVEKVLKGDTASLSKALMMYLGTPAWVDYGAYYSVHCTDEAPFTSAGAVQKEVANAHSILGRVQLFASQFKLDICKPWKHENPGEEENQPVTASVPTLILSGEFDPVTPPEWGRRAGMSITPSYYYEFTGLSHGVFYSNDSTNGCVERVVLSFLENPASEPEAACVQELAPLGFDLP